MQASFLLFFLLPFSHDEWPVDGAAAGRSVGRRVGRPGEGKREGEIRTPRRFSFSFFSSLSRQSAFCAGGGDCSAREDRRAAPRESFTVLVHRAQTALPVSAIIVSASYKKTYL